MVEVAVVLAAGRGKRLGSLTADLPKPLLPVAGRPCLEWILAGLAAAGLREVVLVTGYKAAAVEERVGSQFEGRLAVRYAQQPVPNGTGSAVLCAREAVGDRPFLLTYGDILLRRDNYARSLDIYGSSGCDLLMAVNWVEDPWAGAAIYHDDVGAVTRIVEKPPKGTSSTHWNHAGVVVASPLYFSYLSKLTPSPRGEYELTAAYPPMLADGRRLAAMPVEGYWGDVGTPEDLDRMSLMLASEEGTE
ncbi:MAG TPA: nucleotidyltransferase family protein [Armatimonadota bacterium]|jgi:NDP-sugar pyrophosphorylase family protein